jgi:hypothetical protein
VQNNVQLAPTGQNNVAQRLGMPATKISAQLGANNPGWLTSKD